MSQCWCSERSQQVRARQYQMVMSGGASVTSRCTPFATAPEQLETSASIYRAQSRGRLSIWQGQTVPAVCERGCTWGLFSASPRALARELATRSLPVRRSSGTEADYSLMSRQCGINFAAHLRARRCQCPAVQCYVSVHTSSDRDPGSVRQRCE